MIANLIPYPKMKNSGIEWLGVVPKHWEVLPNRALFAEVKERGHPEEQMLSVTIIKGVIRQQALLADSSKKDSSNQDKSAYKLVRSGDITYNKMRAWQGAVGVSDYQGIVSPAYVVERPRKGASSHYLHHLLRTPAFAKEAERWSYGITSDMWSLRPEHFKMIYGCLPPLPEQTAIVRFLDYFDRRIRRYIRAKQKLIALLEEEKQAIIHQAVTGQIDVCTGQPYPAYKPSGVEWLGDVPENWEKRRLKSISRIRYGLGQPPRELSDGLPLIRATNVDHGRIVEKDLVYVDALDVPKSRDAFLSKKEIIVVRSGAYTADSAIIPEAYEGAVAGYDMIVTVSGAQPEFIAIALLSNYVRDDQLIISSTRSAQPHINAEELGTAVLLLPPLDEQAAIVRYLDKATADIDIATDRARRQIDLLKEYRTRLIADVVTGKGDVRETAAGLPEVDPLAGEFDALTTQAAETGMMELGEATETPEELAMENEVTI